jgi:hypothetical protein
MKCINDGCNNNIRYSNENKSYCTICFINFHTDVEFDIDFFLDFMFKLQNKKLRNEKEKESNEKCKKILSQWIYMMQTD